jgi:hypothetical protein
LYPLVGSFDIIYDESLRQRALAELAIERQSQRVKTMAMTKDNLTDSFIWLWDSSEYRAWHDSEANHIQILYHPAPAAHGKTLASWYVCERLLEQERRGKTVAYFFCSKSDSSVEHLIRSLVGQLLGKNIPDAAEMHRSLSKSDHKFAAELFRSFVPRAQTGQNNRGSETLAGLLGLLAKTLKLIQPGYLIVDGVDQLSQVNQRVDFLKFFLNPPDELKGTKTRIFITSRPYADLVELLKDVPTIDQDTERKRKSFPVLHSAGRYLQF